VRNKRLFHAIEIGAAMLLLFFHSGLLQAGFPVLTAEEAVEAAEAEGLMLETGTGKSGFWHVSRSSGSSTRYVAGL
jgi:hypothetical protein